MLACADIEEGMVLREAGVRAPILVFGALSVSDLDGVFSHRADADHLDAVGAARALQAARRGTATTLRCHLKIDTGMNRLGFRHDNLDRTLPEVAASREPCGRRRLHALRDRRRARIIRRSRAAARFASTHVCARLPSLGIAGPRPSRREQRGAAARRAGLVRLRPARACCSTASFRRRSPRRCRCDLPCHSTVVSWR